MVKPAPILLLVLAGLTWAATRDDWADRKAKRSGPQSAVVQPVAAPPTVVLPAAVQPASPYPAIASPPARQPSIATPTLGTTPVANLNSTAIEVAAAASAVAPAPTITQPLPQQQVAQPVVRAPPRSDGELITNAERLSIKVQGYPDLSGEFRVHADATISIPVIGRISVANADASSLERTLAERVAQLAGRQAFVTVEISQYRPVFVTGYVQTSGATPWKPGMTVLHAVTMAGGIFRVGGDSTAMLAGDVETTRLQRATSDLKRVLATLARVRAEQTGAARTEIPARLLELAEPAEAQQLVDTQNSTFVSRRNALASQLSTLNRAVATSTQELTGLREQSDRLKEQLLLRRELKEKLDVLVAKGIVRAERGIEEMIRLSDLEEKTTNVVVAISRVQSALLLMQREVDSIRQDRQAANDVEIQRLEREAAQLEIDIASARTAYRKITGGLPTNDFASEKNKKITIEYQIVRNGESESTPATASQFVELRPGDIVVVNAKQE